MKCWQSPSIDHDQRERPKVSVLITDLDNTLWDWFHIWHSSFRPFLDELVRVTKIPDEVLKPEIKRVHQRHDTSEYSRVLEELPSLQEKYGPDFDPIEELPSVIEAYQAGRSSASRLYEGVEQTLDQIDRTGAITVGFTESQFYYTRQRIRTLGLDGHLEILYSTENRGTIPLDEVKRLRKTPDDSYKLHRTITRTLPTNSKKPDPALLNMIVNSLGVDKSSVIYVGDNLHKDISMANDAGITSVHAAYGEAHMDARYRLLVDVTHWSQQDVQSQRDTNPESTRPDYVLERSFSDLLDKFMFVPFKSSLKKAAK
jgi:phosphoglycolate phosphatase